jgi:uncharacterized protein (DUF736 family)
MAIIGKLNKDKDAYSGSLTTLTLKAKVRLEPQEKSNDKSPDFKVYSGAIDIGAAWVNQSKEGNDYVSIILDDPSFANSIQARLVASGDEYLLIWKR